MSTVNVPAPSYPWVTRILLPALIMGIMALLLVIAGYDAIAPVQPVRVSPVVQKVATGPKPGSAVVQAAGWVMPDPFEFAVSALADGVVEEVLVLEGDHVEKDEVLVRLVKEDAELELQQAYAALELAQANLKIAQAEFRAASTDWDNPVELKRANTAAAAQLREARARLDKIDADTKADAALLEEAKRSYKRDEQLLREHDVGTVNMVEKAHARYQSLAATLQATKSERASVVATIERIEADVHAAEENYRLRTKDRERLEKSEAVVAQAEAQLAVAISEREVKALQLNRMDVKSPIDGVVMRRLVAPGSKVVRMMDNPHSSHVMHLYDPDQLQVRVDVALADAALISVGQEAEITVEVFPRTVFKGTVSRVTHEANIQKNTIEAQVAITKGPPGLRPDMLTRVRFLSMDSQEASDSRMTLFAQRTTIVRNESGAYVFAIRELHGNRGVVEKISVNPAIDISAEWVPIESGINIGDRLVVNPHPGLSDGLRVEIISEVTDKEMENANGTD